MKIEVLQENLIKALSSLSKIIPSKPTLPILSHILIIASSEEITLIGSDSQTTLITNLAGKIITPGKQTIPFRTLYDIVSSLSDKVVLESDKNILNISSGSYSGKINSADNSEYPNLIPEDKKAINSWEFSKKQLLKLAKQTTFAGSIDESRPALTGVLLKQSSEKFYCVTTDGFRLSVAVDNNLSGGNNSIIIPIKTINEVVRLIDSDTSSKSENVAIKLLENNQINIQFDNISIFSSLINGKFPDFEKIIPSSSQIKAVVSTNELLKAVKLSSVFARDNANIIKIHFSSEKTNSCEIFSQGNQSGENTIEITATFDKEPIELIVAFNYRYLLDFLTSVGECEEVSLELSTATTAGLFRNISDPDYLHIIMPVRVQS